MAIQRYVRQAQWELERKRDEFPVESISALNTQHALNSRISN